MYRYCKEPSDDAKKNTKTAAKKIQSIIRGNATRKYMKTAAPHYIYLNKFNTLPDEVMGKIKIMYKKSVVLETLLKKYSKIYGESDSYDSDGEFKNQAIPIVFGRVLKSKKLTIYDIQDGLDFQIDGEGYGFGRDYNNANIGLKLFGEIISISDTMEVIEFYSRWENELEWNHWFKGLPPNLKKLVIPALIDIKPKTLEGLDHLVLTTGLQDSPWGPPYSSGTSDFLLGTGPYTKIKKVTIYTIMLPANIPRPATSYARENLNPYLGHGLHPIGQPYPTPSYTGVVDEDYTLTNEVAKEIQMRFPDSEIVYSEDGI
jgi:hypothetical protein